MKIKNCEVISNPSSVENHVNIMRKDYINNHENMFIEKNKYYNITFVKNKRTEEIKQYKKVLYLFYHDDTFYFFKEDKLFKIPFNTLIEIEESNGLLVEQIERIYHEMDDFITVLNHEDVTDRTFDKYVYLIGGLEVALKMARELEND